MSDIKTRDVTRGTIKTLDRAASSMHHLKEASIRSKAADISGQHDNDEVNTYARDEAVHYAGDGAIYEAQAGAELIHRSWGEMARGSVQSDENFHNF